jgi:MFS family permease
MANDIGAVPSLVFFFGLVCMATALIKNFAGFLCVRVFLGLAEGGMLPGVAYYLSMWYKRHELAMRIGIFGELHVVIDGGLDTYAPGDSVCLKS